MTDPTHTPPLGTPTTIAGVVVALHHVGAACDERLKGGIAARAILRDVVGGHDKQLGEVKRDHAVLNERVGNMQGSLDKIQTEQKSQRSLLMKLALIMASAGATGAGISHAVLNAL